MANLSGGSVIWKLDVDKANLSKGLSDAKNEVANAAKDIDGSISSIKKSGGGLGQMFREAADESRNFALGLGAVAVAGFGAVGFGVQMAGDIETARQGFTTLLGSTEAADAAIAQIKKDAASTPFSFAGLVKVNQLLTQVTKDAPRSEAMILNVGKALAAAGKGGAELDNVSVNLQQIANTGKITEMDIRQFGFSGINILELLANYYGTTKEAASDMVKNSSDAFADLEGAFAKAGGAGGAFERAFIDQAGTFNQLMSNVGDIVSQTAAEIVVSTGIFDAVKNALAGFISTLVTFQPQIVQGIKDFIMFVTENGPIIAGIILGALTPAFVALAASIGATLLTLAPFMAAGALIALMVQAVVVQLGGWDVAQQKLNSALQTLGNLYNTLIKPALDSLWSTIQNQLLPPLRELWNQVSPILTPALKVLGTIIAGFLYGAFIVIIEVLKLVITWVGQTLEKWNALISFFKSIPDSIKNAFSSVYAALTQPFEAAWGKISEIASKIKAKMDEISPFHRNSPSLVDKVKSGVDIISDKYSSLGDVVFPKASQQFGAESDSGFFSRGFEKDMSTSNTTNSPSIVINIGTIQNKEDIDSLVNELGFRGSLLPAT